MKHSTHTKSHCMYMYWGVCIYNSMVGKEFGINTTNIVVGVAKLHEAKPSAICHSLYNTSGIYPKFHDQPCYHTRIHKFVNSSTILRKLPFMNNTNPIATPYRKQLKEAENLYKSITPSIKTSI